MNANSDGLMISLAAICDAMTLTESASFVKSVYVSMVPLGY